MLRRLLLLALLLVSGSAAAQGYYPGDAVKVNGVAISYQRFYGFYTEYQRSKGVAVGARGDQLGLLTQLRREAMDQMIEQELVRQAARKKGIEVSAEEVDAAVAELRKVFKTPASFASRLQTEGFTEETYRKHMEGMIAAKRYLDDIRAGAGKVSDQELEQYYRDNKQRLTFPEQVRVRQILLVWKPRGTRNDRQATREAMAPILEQARAGEDFAELARKHSEDPETAPRGGDLGFFHRGERVPALEQAAFALKPGEISDMVETPFGVHILLLEERRDAYLLPLDQVRDQLRGHVQDEKAEQAVQGEIARLRDAAEIKILIPL